MRSAGFCRSGRTRRLAALAVAVAAFVGVVAAADAQQPPRARPSGISTRGVVGTGDNVLIGGLIITGSEPKKVLVRAVGPSLTAHGVSGALQNPTLQLFRGSEPIAFNDDWRSSQEGEIAATGR